MAKKTVERGAKSQAIRDALKAGITKPSEIVAHCKQNGIEVKLGLVNSIKAQAKKKKGAKGKPGRKPKSGAMASKNGAAHHGPLESAAEFIRHSGGLEAAQSLLEKIKNLFGSHK